MSSQYLHKLAKLFQRRIFLKYILATLVVGTIINALILWAYYQHRQAVQTGQIATEIATIANRIGRPASLLLREGNEELARELLSVFAAYSYVICADIYLDDVKTPAVSWPIVGCARINKAGQEINVPVVSSVGKSSIQVRINPVTLRSRLLDESLVLVALGTVGGLALILAAILAFLWFINRPLRLLLNAIERFEQFDEPERVAYQSADEIGRVITSYNSMLDREMERVSEIRDSHRSILDSVTYATRIQCGLLPTREQLGRAFVEHNVVWKPRDLVGGDVYWVHSGEGTKTTAAVIDCTGHGVPGGFMTMLAIASLERIISENEEDPSPAEILTRLSDLTQGLLNQDGANPESNDGMDAAICQFDTDNEICTFAGARLSMIVCSDGAVTRFRGDRLSVGYADVPPNPSFSEITVPLGGDARIFLLTDGLIDQVGGERRIAFGYRQLLRVMENHVQNDLAGMVAAIEQEFNDYMKMETARDDITLLAFRPRL